MKRYIPVLTALVIGVLIGIAFDRSRHEQPPTSTSATEPATTPSDHPDHPGHELHGSEVATLDWCAEHRVPESVCTRCNPSLIASFKERGDWCVEHDLPESHCRLCNPGIEFPQEAALRASQPPPELGVSIFFPANQPLCATDQAIIQFASQETFSRAGLTIEPVRSSAEIAAIEAPAEVVFDQEQAAILTLPVRASVIHWLAEPGEPVRAGQMLALCESPETARLKGEYLEACADAERHEKDQARQEAMFRRKLIDAATYEQVHAETRSAAARREGAEHELRSLGLNDEDLAEVRDGKLSARFALRAPASGTLVERLAPLGIALEEGTQLATVADPTDLWIEARVRDTDLPRLRAGQPAVFTSDGGSLERTEARVIWVSQFLDPHSRTGIVRAEPVGDARTLRARQFGHLDFIEAGDHPAVLVPKDAVQWEGCCHVVFVREAADRYRPRKVTLAKGDTEHYRVLDGLNPDEWVVVHGSFLLKTELKKSSIGAGCCGLDAKS